MKNFASIGECMVELASSGEGLYRRGFAGDTLNTAWGVRALSDPDELGVRYLTSVGDDRLSDDLVSFIDGAGIDATRIGRVPGRTVGLYMITLDGHERSFTYWRDTSAAKLLAQDAAALAAALADVDCVYFSGITLAILAPEHRRTLLDVLADIRARGGMVAFDGNARLRLWPDIEAMRAGLEMGYRAATIALPTFPDEKDVFGDASPQACAARITACGVPEVVVKDGAEPCTLWSDGALHTVPAIKVETPVDTTGAGDSFNAGYLAGRLAGLGPVEAARLGHRVAARVICRPGALIDMAELRACR
ncbi:MAG: 2-dehydro-3-deoxygluconokinase [Ancylobacter novellus]|uniref:2-dehydro-3-deoxygluconokinase n=1 Tax=Ancylobacter novellus TaxID=921 RepID=A0A2W5STI9_ANCNO|nr:MAG: 2-dehydro-3-deoxygluconokinase [Ancylobacter novellus]